MKNSKLSLATKQARKIFESLSNEARSQIVDQCVLDCFDPREWDLAWDVARPLIRMCCRWDESAE